MQGPDRLPSFGLSSEQCHLLLAFELASSLGSLAELVGRDVSAVSRQLQRIAQVSPVLAKDQGRWKLTELGHQLNRWTREAANNQQRILKAQTLLRIASTREFASRVLAPALNELVPPSSSTVVSVLTSEEGIEKLLLAGEADLGFDCGQPESPLIRFKRMQRESFCVVASPRFLKKANLSSGDSAQRELLKLPHLQYVRRTTPRVLRLSYAVPHVLATFNDIAAIREAAIAGLGWAVLPVYSVKRELEEKCLVRIEGWQPEDEHFGIWWARGRVEMQSWVERAAQWLKGRDLT